MKRVFSVFFAVFMLSILAIPAGATARAEVIYPGSCMIYNNDVTEIPEGIMPRMNNVQELYTMEIRNLEAGEMVATNDRYNPVTFFASDFPHSAGQIASRFTSDNEWGTIEVGLCRSSSNGSFVPDVKVSLEANGSDSQYFYTTDMDPDKTYYGFIHNVRAAYPVSGTATIYSVS